MKAFVQRVLDTTKIESRNAKGELLGTSSFESFGLVVLLGWLESDAIISYSELEQNELWLMKKVISLRIFPDAQGHLNLSLSDYLKLKNVKGGILWVPQFTLAAELKSGLRPSFSKAMNSQLASQRFQLFQKELEQQKVDTIEMHFGHFGADMNLSFTNWGPLSFMLEK